MISISQYLLAVSAGRAMLSHELDASQFVRHARRASFKDPRPERASRVDLPVPSRYLSPALRPHKSFSCNTYKKPGEGAVGNVFPHHGAFNTASHLPYALPSSASRKSFACRSYENTRGVGGSIPTRQVLLGTFQPSTSILISLPRYFHSPSSEPPIPA